MPRHVGDGTNDSAFTINEETGHWSCWTHQCHEQYGRDLIALVRTYYQCSFKKACEFLQEATGCAESINHASEDFSRVDRMLKHRMVGAAEPIPETMLKQLSLDVSYMINRGFEEAVLREHELGYYEGRTETSFMRNRIVFPIRDHEGRLVGFTARSVIDDAEERKRLGVRKWLNSSSLHLSAYLPKALLLYRSFKVKDLMKGKPLILVEGPIDALRVCQAGITNVCAVLGSSLSKEQEIMIRQMGVRSIVPLFDNDNAGNECIGKIKRRFGGRDIIRVVDVQLPEGKDPGDLTIEEAKEILDGYTV